MADNVRARLQPDAGLVVHIGSPAPACTESTSNGWRRSESPDAIDMRTIRRRSIVSPYASVILRICPQPQRPTLIFQCAIGVPIGRGAIRSATQPPSFCREHTCIDQRRDSYLCDIAACLGARAASAAHASLPSASQCNRGLSQPHDEADVRSQKPETRRRQC